MYYVNENLVKPLTQAECISYAELVGPSPVAWFVSHYWGTGLRHFVESIRKHALLMQGEERPFTLGPKPQNPGLDLSHLEVQAEGLVIPDESAYL